MSIFDYVSVPITKLGELLSLDLSFDFNFGPFFMHWEMRYAYLLAQESSKRLWG